MKYIQHLETIHPSERTSADSGGSLATAVKGLDSIGDIQSTVGQALRFVSETHKLDPRASDVVDSVRWNQTTNCIGYALVGSECLEETVGSHYIIFANGHAFTATAEETPYGPALHSRDFLSPHIDTTINSGLDIPVKQLLEQTTDPEHPRGGARLNAHIFTGESLPIEELMQKVETSWLYVGDSFTSSQSKKWISDPHQGFTLVASIYKSPLGRRILEDYVRFRQAVKDDQQLDAAAILRGMSGLYPDIDARKPHKAIRRLIGRLAAVGHIDIANRAITDYTDSFRRSKDARLMALKADLYGIAARAAEDKQFATRAIDTYRQAASRSRHSWGPDAWHARAQRIEKHFS